MQITSLLVFEKSRSGHREEYANIFSKVLGGQKVMGFSFTHIIALLKCPVAIFSSCDDYLIRFLFISSLRNVLGRPSIAIATRAEAIYKSHTFKIKLKKLIYAFLRHFPSIKIVSILPFYIEPRLVTAVDDWIYDPQFWDIPRPSDKENREKCPTEILRHIDSSQNKLIVILPGKISKRKGAEFMIELFLADYWVRNTFLFILGGEILDLKHELVSAFKNYGGIVLDRKPTDEEFIGMCQAADIIWTCYEKTFNHSSGIFGRALQLGTPVIVRKGSYLSSFGIPCSMKCEFDYDDIYGDIEALKYFKNHMSTVPIQFSSEEKMNLIYQRVICKK